MSQVPLWCKVEWCVSASLSPSPAPSVALPLYADRSLSLGCLEVLSTPQKTLRGDIPGGRFGNKASFWSHLSTFDPGVTDF